MALDGLWIVQFTGKDILGSGVVVFSSGKLFGGETGTTSALMNPMAKWSRRGR